MSDQTPEAERTALEELLQSEGWAVYAAHISKAWGAEAMEAALRDSKSRAAPEEWPFESTRILDTFAGMRANMLWPSKRIEALKSGERTKRSTIVDRFKDLRRA